MRNGKDDGEVRKKITGCLRFAALTVSDVWFISLKWQGAENTSVQNNKRELRPPVPPP